MVCPRLWVCSSVVRGCSPMNSVVLGMFASSDPCLSIRLRKLRMGLCNQELFSNAPSLLASTLLVSTHKEVRALPARRADQPRRWDETVSSIRRRKQ